MYTNARTHYCAYFMGKMRCKILDIYLNGHYNKWRKRKAEQTGTNKGHAPGSRQPDSLRKPCTGGAVHPAKQINAAAPASLGKIKSAP